MDYTVIIFIFTLSIGQGFAYTLGDCEITDNGEIDWTVKLIQLDPVKDVETLSKSYAYTGPLVVDTPLDGDTGKKYIDVTSEDNQITIKTNEEFNKNFENDQRTTVPGSPISISRTIKFTCGELSEQIITVLSVEDTNNNKPAFKASTYEYTMPMPLVPRIDLTSLGDAIIVEDLDFSNTDVTFTVSDNKFELETTPGEDPRLYRAILRVSSYTTLTEETKLTITATDNGNPASSSTVDITITIDADLSLPSIPTFTDALYRFAYSEDGGTPTITPSDSKEIVVKTDDPSNTAVTLNTDVTKYFTVTFDEATSKVTLGSTGTAVDKSSEPALVSELTVTFNDESSKAVILIDLPTEVVVSVPKFSAPFYRADYLTDADPNTITVVGDISVTQDADVTVDDTEHFSITKSEDKWVLNVVKNLGADVLKAGEDIVLTLTASVAAGEETLEGQGTVIVKLPEIVPTVVPQFSAPFYRADYSTDTDPNTIKVVGDISVTGDADVTVDDTEHFSITKSEDKWVLNVVENLGADVLKAGEDIVLTLTASVVAGEETLEGQGTVIVKLPEIVPTVVPQFSAPFYRADYSTDTDPNTITVVGDISVTGDADVTVDDTEYFSITKSGDKWILNVAKNLEPDVLKTGEDIILTLSASVAAGENTLVGQGTVIVKLPEIDQIEVPEFTEIHYSGTYETDENELPIVALTEPIAATSPDQTVEISFDETSDIFSIDSKTGVITVIGTIDETVGQYVLTLKASIPAQADVGSGYATVIITVPAPGPAPKFAKTYYTAEYKVSSESEALDALEVIDGPIELTIADTTVDVTIQDGTTNSEFFDVALSDDKTNYIVSVKSNLEDTTLISEVDIVLTLQAKVDDTIVSEATLVVKLPKETAPAAFSKPFYEAEYAVTSDGGLVTITNGPIELSGNYLNNIKVTLVEPTDIAGSFVITSESPYTLSVTTELDDEILKTKHEIVLTLIASLAGSDLTTTSSIVMTLPEIPTAPKFAKVTYIGKYDKTPSITLTDKISTNAADPSTVKITAAEPYSENFIITYDNSLKEHVLSVNQALQEPVVDQGDDIYVTLQATIEGSVDDSFATLIVHMPEKTENIIPQFSKSYYKATYNMVNETNTDDTITDPAITIASDQASETTVTVIDTYKDYFKAELDQPSSTWKLTVIKDLETSILTEGTFVVTLQASLIGSSKVGQAIVILSLPGEGLNTVDAAPQFSQPYYEGEYTVDGKLDPADPIVVTSTHLDDVEVDIDEKYKNNFDIAKDTETSQWTLTATTPLSLDTDETELLIKLTAHLENSAGDDMATFIVKLPPKDEAIAFDSSYYEATYTVVNDKTDTVTIDGDKQISLGTDATVTIPGAYSENFAISCADLKCVLTVTKDLEADVLESLPEIILVLEASNADTTEKGTCAVIVKLPLEDAINAPEFSQVVYSATYGVADDGSVTITSAVPIKFKDGTDTTDIEVSIDAGENQSYFDINPKDDHWEVTATTLPNELIDENVSILINLIATKTGVTIQGKAGLVIQLPKKSLTTTFYFEDNVYLMNYKDGEPATIEPEKDIIIKGDADNAADLNLIGEDAELFKVDYAENKVTVELKNTISPDDLRDKVVLTFDIVANKDSETATTTIVVQLPKNQEVSGLAFTEVTYVVSYTISDSLDSIKLENGPIQIKGIEDPSTAIVAIEDAYETYFQLAFDTDQWKLTLKKDLESNTIDDNISVLVKLTATTTDALGEARLVINLPRKLTTTTIYFNDNAYIAAYVEDPAALNFEKEITIEGDADSSAAITLTGDYSDSFDFVYSDNKVAISVKTPISADVLSKNVAISFKVEAVKGSETIAATIVVELPKNEVTSGLEFTKPAYIVSYTSNKDGLDVVNVENGPISITGIEDLTTATVVIEEDYAKYFQLELDTDEWKLTVKENLDANTINEKTSLVVKVTATTTDAAGETNLVINLPRKLTNTTIYFNDYVYMADYVENDPATVDLEKEITIGGDADNSAVITLTGELAASFKHEHSDNKVTISLISPFPQEIFNQNVAVTLNIEASKDSETIAATIVIKLPKGADTTGVEFTNVAYVASYTQKREGLDEIVDENGPITITGIDDLSTVVVELEDTNADNTYKDYFKIDFDSDKWVLVVVQDLISDIIDENTSLLFKLVAKVGELVQGQSNLVINLPKKLTNTTFYFNDNVYVATYSDGKIDLASDITMSGDSENVEVTLSGEWADQFTSSYADGKINIQLKSALSDKVLEEEAAITLDVLASNEDEETKTTLFIKLPKGVLATDDDSGGDKTGLIAAVAVLAVLLVAALVGSAVFYYLKFKRANTYNSGDDAPRLSDRFRKNSNNAETKHKVEHPTRRATGVIKLPLKDEVVGETTTDGEEIMDRRKSVQFDTENIDELEIEKPEDDDTDSTYENLADDESDERRTSKV